MLLILGVHRSYMNLFSATSREQGFEDNGFESLRLADTYDDEDSDEPLNSTFVFGDEYSAHALWAGKLYLNFNMENFSFIKALFYLHRTQLPT